MTLGLRGRVAVVETRLEQHMRECGEAARRTETQLIRIDERFEKFGGQLERLSDRIADMHSQNQRWIRSTAAAVIMMLVSMIGYLAKALAHL
ncbi:MAG TPA: hypothetical protein VJ770_21265 [Stellaceae bacterium]|nr:hypothetical protein [Stellaceae bacterium]